MTEKEKKTSYGHRIVGVAAPIAGTLPATEAASSNNVTRKEIGGYLEKRHQLSKPRPKSFQAAESDKSSAKAGGRSADAGRIRMLDDAAQWFVENVAQFGFPVFPSDAVSRRYHQSQTHTHHPLKIIDKTLCLFLE